MVMAEINFLVCFQCLNGLSSSAETKYKDNLYVMNVLNSEPQFPPWQTENSAICIVFDH